MILSINLADHNHIYNIKIKYFQQMLEIAFIKQNKYNMSKFVYF